MSSISAKIEALIIRWWRCHEAYLEHNHSVLPIPFLFCLGSRTLFKVVSKGFDNVDVRHVESCSNFCLGAGIRYAVQWRALKNDGLDHHRNPSPPAPIKQHAQQLKTHHCQWFVRKIVFFFGCFDLDKCIFSKWKWMIFRLTPRHLPLYSNTHSNWTHTTINDFVLKLFFVWFGHLDAVTFF